MNGELPKQTLKERLNNRLTEIARERDPYFASAGHFYVQHYIRSTLEEWGIVETHEFQVRGTAYQNLILHLPPQPTPQRKVSPIIVGAHYDAVPGTPGADDNATGVAVLLELARAFATQPPQRPVQLVAFDMEEYGLLGSTAYATELKQRGESVRLMLSLEMLGYCDRSPGSQRYPGGLKYLYPDRGDFIALIGNLAAIPDLLKLNRSIHHSKVASEWLPVPLKGILVPPTRYSDHSPFWDRGYRAIMVTDTAFLRNPHYHQASDTLSTLDLDFLTGICEGLRQGIYRL